MMIIGCDLHTRYQQIAMVDTETGEFVQRRLEHESGEARGFYAGLKGAVRVGIEIGAAKHRRPRPSSRAVLGADSRVNKREAVRSERAPHPTPGCGMKPHGRLLARLFAPA